MRKVSCILASSWCLQTSNTVADMSKGSADLVDGVGHIGKVVSGELMGSESITATII
jgi:hypothetical protein